MIVFYLNFGLLFFVIDFMLFYWFLLRNCFRYGDLQDFLKGLYWVFYSIVVFFIKKVDFLLFLQPKLHKFSKINAWIGSNRLWRGLLCIHLLKCILSRIMNFTWLFLFDLLYLRRVLWMCFEELGKYSLDLGLELF